MDKQLAWSDALGMLNINPCLIYTGDFGCEGTCSTLLYTRCTHAVKLLNSHLFCIRNSLATTTVSNKLCLFITNLLGRILFWACLCINNLGDELSNAQYHFYTEDTIYCSASSALQALSLCLTLCFPICAN